MNTTRLNSPGTSIMILVFTALIIFGSSLSVSAQAEKCDPPVADFIGEPLEGCNPLTVEFSDLSSGLYNYLSWDFGDGTIYEGGTYIYRWPEHTYTQSGLYTVSLTVTGPGGFDTETKVTYIKVYDKPISADFSVKYTPDCNGSTVELLNQSVGAKSWLWDFGDGTSSPLENPPDHYYGTPGTYTITLTAKNSCGSLTESMDINVTSTPDPIAEFRASSTTACIGENILFSDLSTDATSWAWNFGDGHTSGLQNPSHAYSIEGQYTVSLTVKNDCGEDDEIKVLYISIYPNPDAKFTFDAVSDCFTGHVEFTDHSTDADAWQWDFGDGNYSSDQHPSHKYNQPGTYTVTLTASNLCNSDVETKSVVIDSSPEGIADFTVNKTNACIDETVTFTDQSTGAVSWYWDFGDGNTSTDQNPTHAYAATGVYNVELEIMDSCGKIDKELKEAYITVSTGPVADFRPESYHECTANEIHFVDLSTYATSWDWDFGDGNTSTQKEPVHTYAASGTYDAKLTVKNDCGQDDKTITLKIIIIPDPVADYTYELTQFCSGGRVQFTDQSTDAISWLWDFDDGYISTDPNPEHFFNIARTYNVKLTVKGICGEDDITKSIPITVDQPPHADFRADPLEGCVGKPINFDDRSYLADEWEWNFGDGNTSTDQNPSHTYSTAGFYTVSLKVSNDCGYDTETKVQYILIKKLPTANFTAQVTTVCVEEDVHFIDLSSHDVNSWSWNFGDGATSSQENPSHQYSRAGDYTVSLTVRNDCGDDTETKIEYITVLPSSVSAFTATPTQGNAPLTVDFTNQSTNATTWEWNFGDGTTSTELHPQYIYPATGQYTVILSTFNECGDDQSSDVITVTESTCQADFDSEVPYGCSPLTVYFYDQSDCEVNNWLWNFGDGSSSTLQNPDHTYINPGFYKVSLTITFDGGTDTKTKIDFIKVKDAPTSAFTATPTQGEAPLTVDFTDLSLGATSWEWDFDDGTPVSTDQHPTYTFATFGTFTVTLTSTNECGSRKSTKEIIVTDPSCQVDFGSEVPSGCGPLTVYFNGFSNCEVISWAWNFGDGNTSTLQYPDNTYLLPGIYTVSLTATFADGTDTETKVNHINVFSSPTSAFTALPTHGDVPLTVQFTDNSIAATSWSWDFDDGSPASTDQNPTHTFTVIGIYTVTLTSSNECGSKKSTEIITVKDPNLNADFTAEPLSGCSPLIVYFSDLSTGDITSWLWDFGDGTSSTDQNPNHDYTVSGDYMISLTITGPDGTDTESKLYTFIILAPPIADFTYITNPSNRQAPVTANFTNISTGSTSWSWDFGDGNTSTSPNPTHIYVDSGHFTVVLTAKNACGIDTKTTEIVVERTFAPGMLRLFTTVDKVQAPPEDTLLYTITIRNTENAPIANVIVQDTIPELTAYVASSAVSRASQRPKTSYDGLAQTTSTILFDALDNMIIWSVDTINALDSVKMEFKVVIDQSAPNGYIVTNKAIITNPADQYTESVVTTEVIAPTITIEKSAYPTIANAGDTITYTIQVTNTGNYGLTDAIIEDDHPDDFNFVQGSAMVDGIPAISVGTDPIRIVIGDIGFPDTVVITYLSEIPTGLDYSLPFDNYATLYDNNGDGASHSWGPVMARVGVEVPPLIITKRSNVNSGFPGDIIDFTIIVENVSTTTALNSFILDTLPYGFAYIDSTTIIDQAIAPDPAGINPLTWQMGDLDPGDKVTLRYTVQLSTRILGGINENIAWAHADDFVPSRATCRVNVIPSTLSGSIRGRVIVDCGDGEIEFDTTLSGVDLFLDDGSRSQVNNKGMFYFSTVRPGQRAVMIDTRDLSDRLYDLADGQIASVFVFVHETGESYLIFKVCPAQPILKLNKLAAQVPTAMITKSASIDTTQTYDSTGVVVDYEISIDYNGGAEAVRLKIVDSLPDETQLSMVDGTELIVSSDGKQLYNEFTVGADGFRKSMKYSIEDLDPGSRKFLENTIYIEGSPDTTAKEYTRQSTTVTVAVGPLRTAPDTQIKMNIIGAYFETSKAFLRPEALPILEAIADSILKYSDVTIRTEGHCDYRRINTVRFPSNWELSEARALSVLTWLNENHNIDTSLMSYEGFAATIPVDTGHSEVHWQQNRRVEVFITGRNRSQVDYSQIPVNNWEATTILELEPINWDTVLVPDTDGAAQIGPNTWEVLIVIENVGYYSAENVVLEDILPINGEYVLESATVDGEAARAAIGSDGHLLIEIDKIDREQKIEVRYRFKASPDTNPSGSGEAIIEMESRGKTVTHRSNTIRFE